MADPVTRKIDTLTPATTVANNDELIVMDVSESAVDMTKKMTMSQIPISLASQLGANVVENSKIKDGAVTTTKILDGNVTYAKIQKSQNAFVLGNKASTTGTADAIVEIQPSAASQVLLGSTGTTNTVDFGKVTSAHIAAMTSAQLAGIISNETGSGALVFATSPTLVTPALGTPASGTLTNCTGLTSSGIENGAVTEAKIGTGAVTPTKTNFFGGSAIYFGVVAANGTAISLPSGWSVSRGSVGHYTVTHPSFALNFPVVSAQYMSTVNAVATYFDVNTMNSVEFRDAAFWFILIVG
jgi:hypothetical protein